MRKILIIIAFILPTLALHAQKAKEIAPAKLPDNVTSYISANLPNAKITKVVKQKRNPDATYVVSVSIKTKYHKLVFNKAGVLVKLDGKKLKATVKK
jgi:hypothetical protein